MSVTETPRDAAIVFERRETAELGPSSTLRLGLVLAAAVISAPVGCGPLVPPPGEMEPGDGSPPDIAGTTTDSAGFGNETLESPAGAGATTNTSVPTGDGAASDGAASDGATSGDSEDDGAASDGDGETDAFPCGQVDTWEPNDLPESAAMFPWPGYSIKESVDAFLCAGDDDWYHFGVAGQEYYLYLDGIVMGSSWCGESCDQPWLPDAPENTMAVQVYDAGTWMLLDEDVATDGRVYISGYYDDELFPELLIRVYGPTLAATFAYELTLEMRDYDGEDECEC